MARPLGTRWVQRVQARRDMWETARWRARFWLRAAASQYSWLTAATVECSPSSVASLVLVRSRSQEKAMASLWAVAVSLEDTWIHSFLWSCQVEFSTVTRRRELVSPQRGEEACKRQRARPDDMGRRNDTIARRGTATGCSQLEAQPSLTPGKGPEVQPRVHAWVWSPGPLLRPLWVCPFCRGGTR